MKRYIAVLELEAEEEIIDANVQYIYRKNGTNYARYESVEFKADAGGGRMTEEKVQELLENLRGLTYFTDILGKKERFSVIAQEGYDKVENVIRQFLLDNHDGEYGELQAKVYTYEKIIANSNFAPMIKKEQERNRGNEEENEPT